MRRVRGVLRLCFGLLLGCAFLMATPSWAVPPPPPVATTINVTLIDSLSPQVAGRATDFSATLRDDQGSPVAGQTLNLWVQPAGSTGFVPAGQATTDQGGQATVWATLDHDALVRWTYDGNASGSTPYAASTPVEFGVEVAPLVTARAHDRTLHRGQRLIVTGRTYPAKSGCTVSLWRGVPRPLTTGPAPKLLARSTVRADGSYRLVRRLHRVRTFRAAVTVASCDGNAGGLSRSMLIRVR